LHWPRHPATDTQPRADDQRRPALPADQYRPDAAARPGHLLPHWRHPVCLPVPHPQSPSRLTSRPSRPKEHSMILTRRALLITSTALLTIAALAPAMAQDKTSVTAALVAEPTSLNPIYDTG